MATSFPTGLDALTNPTGASSLTSPDHAGQHADANDAIEALEAKVGVTNSAVTTSLDYRVRNIDATTAIVNGNTSTDLVAITQAGTGIALDVIGSSTVGSQTNVSGVFGSAASGRLLLGSITGNTPFIGSEGATTLALTTDSAIRMRIDSDGNIGIGTASSASRKMIIGGSFTGGTGFVTQLINGTFASDVLTEGVAFRSVATTAAASFTLPALIHYHAVGTTRGTGSTITSQYGFLAASTLTTGTNNYGFFGDLASSANNYNLYMAGNAYNYLAGRLGVGATLTSGSMAQITNTTAGDKAFVVKGAAGQSGDFFDVQDSAGASRLKVLSTGIIHTFEGIEVGSLATGNRYAGIDFLGDSTYTDFSLRLMRQNTGANAASQLIHRGTGILTIIAQDAAPILFSTTNAERMRIDPTGNLLVGATSRRSVGGGFQTTSVNAIFNEQAGVGGALTPFTSVINRADSNGLRFILGKSRGTAAGAVTALVDGDSIAEFHFAGADGSTLDPLAARIMTHVDGAVATGSVPGRLSFATNPVAGTNPIERMRITSAGNVGIGNTAPTSKLEVDGSDTIDSQANVAAQFGTSGGTNNLLVGSITGNTPFVGSQGASALTFRTNNAERIRIDSDGNVGIGTASLTGISFRVGKIITGAINSYASIFQGTVQEDVTSQAYGVYASLSTIGTPTTAPTLTLFAATQGTLAGTVTSNTQRGYFADSNLIGATNNYAFQGAIPSGAGRYNLYMSGTAQNYLSGNLGIGITVPTSKLHVVNTTAGDKALVVKAAASQSGSLLEVQNSSGTALVTIDSAGKVGIGNTAPENTLDITGSFGRGNPAVKTANFTLAGTENWIICNGAGTINITLPTPSTCDGREFGIKTVSPQLVQSASSDVIAIGGGTAGTAILPATSGAWAILVSDGSSWNIMCRGT